MKTPFTRILIIVSVAVVGLAAGLPATAARAGRPPVVVTPPTAVSGL